MENKKYVYVVIPLSRGGRPNQNADFLGVIHGVYTDFERAEAEAFKGWEGVVKIVRKTKLSDTITYEMELTNINGTHYYYILIIKKELDK